MSNDIESLAALFSISPCRKVFGCSHVVRRPIMATVGSWRRRVEWKPSSTHQARSIISGLGTPKWPFRGGTYCSKVVAN